LPQRQTLTLALAKPVFLPCSLRQYPLYSKPTVPAVLADHFTPQVFEKSQKYGKHKAKFSIVSGLYKQFIETVQLASGLYYPWAWSASGQLLGQAGYGTEYLVCPHEFVPRAAV
jgi:STE24 endopeptidase